MPNTKNSGNTHSPINWTGWHKVWVKYSRERTPFSSWITTISQVNTAKTLNMSALWYINAHKKRIPPAPY